MTPSSPLNVPLKKRPKHKIGKNPDDQAEASAAAALASLADKRKISHSEDSSHSSENDGDVSDSEASYTSQNKVLPKAIHAPAHNPMMVDHTYTDYSVISERTLAFLEEGELDYQANLPEEEKKVEERRIKKIKKIFGDIGPSRKNSGGVVKPFPEKVSDIVLDDACFSMYTVTPEHFGFSYD